MLSMSAARRPARPGDDMDETCPVCGETAPEPRWTCLYRASGSAVPGRPCGQSVEGQARLEARLAAAADRSGRRWCQPGDVRERTWIVTFGHDTRDAAVFFDEREARAFYERADAGGWICTLFQAAPLVAEPDERA